MGFLQLWFGDGRCPCALGLGVCYFDEIDLLIKGLFVFYGWR
jgi:hypothetical protein